MKSARLIAVCKRSFSNLRSYMSNLKSKKYVEGTTVDNLIRLDY